MDHWICPVFNSATRPPKPVRINAQSASSRSFKKISFFMRIVRWHRRGITAFPYISEKDFKFFLNFVCSNLPNFVIFSEFCYTNLRRLLLREIVYVIV